MGFFGNAKGSLISDYFKLLENIGDHKAGNMCEVRLYDDHLTIHSPLVKQDISLNYNKITDVFHGYKTELVQVKKSVIKRALVGGILTGGVGAIVGGMSGIGDKQKKETRLYLIISYNGTNKSESFLQFEDTRHYKGRKLAATLRELCEITNTSSTSGANLEL